MSTIWDFLPAVFGPTQSFVPPVNRAGGSDWSLRPAVPWELAASTPQHLTPGAMAWWRPSAAPEASFVDASQIEPYRGSYIADDDRYQQMLADAKRAYEFVMWHFGRPPHVPAPSVPYKAPPKAPAPFEGAPLRPPVPPDGYNEWDKLNRFYEDSELLDSDPGILAPDPVPGATLDRRMEIDPRTVLTPQFPLRKRIAR